MRTVSAADVLRAMKALLDGGDRDGDADALPAAVEFPRYRSALDLGMNHAWRSEWWPELMRTQRRFFRNNWAAGSTYNKTNEVYDAATQQYFQCLRDGVTGAGNSPTDSAGVERSSHWAKCLTAYSGSNWSSASVSYAVGTKVFYPVTQRHYQCHTAHTSSATLTPDAAGGNERWGVLTEFDRNISLTQSWETDEIGDCFDVKNANPKTSQNWRSLDWDNSDGGIQVLEEAIFAWVQFRLPRQRLFGNVYSATATYAVGDQIYFDTAVAGNFYKCVTATSAGDSPTSAAAKWSLIQIPEIFFGLLVHLGVGKLMMTDGDEDRATVPLRFADEDLGIEADVIYRQQARSPAMPMRTY